MNMLSAKPYRRNVLVAALLCLGLSGCIGGCIDIPTITIPVTLITNANIPGLPISGVPINQTFNFPELCDFPDIADIELKVQESPLGFLAKWINIDSVIVTNITVTATAGTLESFDTLSMSLVISGQTFNIGTGSPSSDGTKIVLTAENPPNLYEALHDLAPGACINAQFGVVGEAPTEALSVTVTSEIQVEASFE